MIDEGATQMRNGLRDEQLERLARSTIGAAIEVHRALGPGFLESVYEEALCIELRERNIAFARQHEVAVLYKGHTIGTGKVDILVEGKLIVELKAVEALADIHTAQILSYLKATKCRLGLLLNFNVPTLRDGLKRVAL